MIDVLILCGGYGTRFNVSKNKINKPLVLINNKTILERIIRKYDENNCRFLILGGYKFKDLKKYIFKNFKNKNILVLNTGLKTSTAGRILKVKKFIKSEVFCVTYGDSLANYNFGKAMKLKKSNNFIISAYKKFSLYGVIKKNSNKITNIEEKKTFNYINAGFYIFDKNIFKFIKSKIDKLEVDVFRRVLKSKYKFKEFYVSKWFPMDTPGNKMDLEILLKKNNNYFE
jgi:glucose-1-phosphate cytidylyltransferase